MNKAAKTTVILALITISVLAGRSFNSPSEAAMNCPELSQYANQGFTTDTVTASPIYYIVPPTGTYNWGKVTVETHGRTGGYMSFETTYATVTCYIQAKQQGNTVKYSVTGTDVTEMVVF